MNNSLADFDEFGVFDLRDAELIALISGGDIGVYVRTGLGGIYGGDLQCQSFNADSDIINLQANWRCQGYPHTPSEITYNALCKEGTSGTNPVCLTNIGC